MRLEDYTDRIANPGPDDIVLFSSGNLTVEGQTADPEDRVTVVALGTVTIVPEQDPHNSNVLTFGIGGDVQANRTGVVAVAAGCDVVIAEPNPAPDPNATPPTYLNWADHDVLLERVAVLAPNGALYPEGSLLAPDPNVLPPNPPVLRPDARALPQITLNGSTATGYWGTYGFFSVAGGSKSHTSGYDFTVEYPSGWPDIAPPWWPDPAGGSWVPSPWLATR